LEQNQGAVIWIIRKEARKLEKVYNNQPGHTR
jgi:hypothetical protein